MGGVGLGVGGVGLGVGGVGGCYKTENGASFRVKCLLASFRSLLFIQNDLYVCQTILKNIK